MIITKIEDLPINENTDTRIKIIESTKNYITFFVRTMHMESKFKIERPKNKYWKNVKLSPGSKIDIKIESLGKEDTKQLVRVK